MKKFTFIITMLIGIVLLAIMILYLNTSKPVIEGMVSPKPLPAFQLTDHYSQPFTEKNLQSNQWKILFFGYTHCPDICPTTLSMLQGMKKQLNEKYAQDTQFIFVSFDEELDTPETLKNYLNFFDPAFLGLSGRIQNAEQLIKMLRVVYLKVPKKDSHLIDHTATLYLINPQGQWVASFNPPFEPVKLSQQYQKIRAFLGEQPK
jgi:protein SCO1/2